MNRHRVSEGAQRLARRWQQADEAPRLLTEVPELDSLRMQIEESASGGTVGGSKHTRLFILATAPALFLVPCGDPRCQEGGHDLTRSIMGCLREHKERFEGQDACNGTVGSGPCTSVIQYSVTATYSASQLPGR